MAELPTPGSDIDTWGEELNEFLRVSHNDDGTEKSGGSSAVQTVTVVVTADEVLAWFDTPTQLLPAPGAGKAIMPLQVLCVRPSGTAYVLGSDAPVVALGTISDGALAPLASLAEVLGIDSLGLVTLDAIGGLGMATVAATETAAVNRPLLIGCDDQNPADGTGSITVTVLYTILDVA